MSTGLYSHTTRGTGTVLTAAIYNADHQNHITNQNPQMTGAYSDNVTQMQALTDPGGIGSESLAPHLAGEIERLRFTIKGITGKAQWYAPPAATLESLAGGTFTQQLNIAIATNPPLTLRRTENDTTERTIQQYMLGSGAGQKAEWHVKGTGANNVTEFALFMGATEVWRATSTAVTFGITLAVGGNLSLSPTGHIDMAEISAPAAPGSNINRIYAKDFGGVTELYYKDSAGVENVISPPGAVVGRGYGEYTGSDLLGGSIPLDNTQPQNTEGDQIVTATITLQKSTNRVRARFSGWVGCTDNVGVRMTGAIFCSTSANAIQTTVVNADIDSPGTLFYNMGMDVEHAPGSVGPLTYQVRTGCSNDQYRFNGNASGGAIHGGSSRAALILEEIQV